MDDKKLPMLKPAPGEITVECPKCRAHVSETCCAYQDFDYYKDCYHFITRPGANQQTTDWKALSDGLTPHEKT